MKFLSRLTSLIFICLACSCLLASCGQSSKGEHKLSLVQSGDIVFQDFPSSQSNAIKIATDSRFSHCGIVFIQRGRPWVWEAVQPVKRTPLEKWITRNEKGEFYIKRLKNAGSVLNDSIVGMMIVAGQQHFRKDYDIYFNWSDERMYCSEYVWKVYNRALGIELGSLNQLREYNLDHPEVRSIMAERYGDDIPYDEPVISPQDIWDSDLLESVD